MCPNSIILLKYHLITLFFYIIDLINIIYVTILLKYELLKIKI